MNAFCNITNLPCENGNCFQECNITEYHKEAIKNPKYKHIPCVAYIPDGIEPRHDSKNAKFFINNNTKPFFESEKPERLLHKISKPKNKYPMHESPIIVKLTDEQVVGRTEILKNAITILYGKAGSGKTFCAAYTAIELYRNKEMWANANCHISNIIFCTPIPDNDELGFLRGTLQEKMEPRTVGIKTILSSLMLTHEYKEISRQKLKFLPLSHIRGLTFNNSFVIVDESQNLTTTQIKLLIGRLGKKSKIVFCGDESQIDLKDNTESGFAFLKGIAKNNIDGLSSIEFENNNRHPIIDKIFHFYSYQ